jgi:hypothetical protein
VEKHLATALLRILRAIQEEECEVRETQQEGSGHDSRSITD